MNILAFDTCFDACSAAAGRGLRTLTPSIAAAFEPMQAGHAERLVPMIEEVMAAAKLPFTKLDRIAVTLGPGTFTGTRIAVAAARSFALATGVPVVAMTSLNLMAMSPLIAGEPGRALFIATDARRGEIYLQEIDRHTLKARDDARAVALDCLAEILNKDRPVTFAGSGASQAAEAASLQGFDALATAPHLLPDALDMLFAAAGLPVCDRVEPLYLRAPDAKPPSRSPFAARVSA